MDLTPAPASEDAVASLPGSFLGFLCFLARRCSCGWSTVFASYSAAIESPACTQNTCSVMCECLLSIGLRAAWLVKECR